MDLSEVVQGIDEQEKLALEQFITEFFAALLQQVRNYRDPAETDNARAITATIASKWWRILLTSFSLGTMLY